MNAVYMSSFRDTVVNITYMSSKLYEESNNDMIT